MVSPITCGFRCDPFMVLIFYIRKVLFGSLSDGRSYSKWAKTSITSASSE